MCPGSAGIGLATHFSFGAGRFEFAVARRENLGVVDFEFVFGRDESDGAVQSDLGVTRHELGHDTSSVVERQRRLRSDAFGLEGLVPPLDLAVRLSRQLHP